MGDHPLPALPHDIHHDEVQIKSRRITDSQLAAKCDYTDSREGIGQYYTLISDTTETDLRNPPYLNDEHRTLLKANERPASKIALHRPVYASANDAYDNYQSVTAHTKYEECAALHGAPEKQDEISYTPIDRDTLQDPYQGATLGAACDCLPHTYTTDQCNNGILSRDRNSLYEVPTDDDEDDDDEQQRVQLVRFAEALTILYSPTPPTPPPHRTPTPKFPTLPPALPNFKPYGPRIPPWGSLDNLDRERRSRSNLRVLEDTLGECFSQRERLRQAEGVRNGRKRTEGEELRELVLGMYPEIETRRAERKTCFCSCAVM